MNQRNARRGFTLIQLLIVIGIISLLAAMLLGVVGRGRSAARRAECDSHLKEIAMALDTFRQETGRYPTSLAELRTKKYLSPSVLRCPSDPDEASHGYEDFYMVREPRDSEELPMVVCPFHEGEGQHGAQAYKGRYTAQFSTQPATLVSAIGATVMRPGQSAQPGTTGMRLNGGDRVVTGLAGSATLRFADTSTAMMNPNCDLTVLEAFVDGQRRGPLYTLVRQNVPQTIGGAVNSNVVSYNVHHGSSFDVATPTATAGALGTEFTLKVTGPADANTQLTVVDSIVALTTTSMTEQIANDKTVNPAGITVSPGDPARAKVRAPRGLPGAYGDSDTDLTIAPTATPVPTATPTPRPPATPTPTPCPHDNRDGGKCR